MLDRFIIYAACVAIGAAFGFSATSSFYKMKMKARDAEYQAATIKAFEEARRIEQANAKKVQEALNEAKQREAKNLADANAARSAATSLRDKLAAYKRSLPGVSADACRDYSAALADVLGDSVETYRSMAEEADRLANDLRTLNDARPR